MIPELEQEIYTMSLELLLVLERKCFNKKQTTINLTIMRVTSKGHRRKNIHTDENKCRRDKSLRRTRIPNNFCRQSDLKKVKYLTPHSSVGCKLALHLKEYSMGKGLGGKGE